MLRDWKHMVVPGCRAVTRELKQTKGALQTQLKGMVAAEQELTQHLKTTHAQIEEQLQALRDQLKVGQHLLLAF
jgi:predicted  nucleic acid-binding Zn-ribbon protein